MANKDKLLGSSAVSTTYSITLTKAVRKNLNVKSGDILGYYLSKDNKIRLISGELSEESLEGTTLIGSSKITASFASTLPKKIRNDFNVKPGDFIPFYLGSDNKIFIQT